VDGLKLSETADPNGSLLDALGDSGNVAVENLVAATSSLAE
jgi:hypothetical protein